MGARDNGSRAPDVVDVGGRPRAPGEAPQISVLLPVRDGERHLRESVDSILRQSLGAFELLVLDDASTDGTASILDEYGRRDARLHRFRSREPLGVGPGLNYLAARARASLAARMDADDVAHPDRLRRQRDVFAARPDAVLVGTLWEGIDQDGRLVRPRDRWPLWRGWRAPPFPGGSAMFRMSAFRAAGGYRDLPWEDVDLAVRLARHGAVITIVDALYRYRFHVTSASQRHARSEMLASLTRMQEALGVRVGSGTRAAYFLEASRMWAGHVPRADDSRDLGWSQDALRLRLLRALGRRPAALRALVRQVVRGRDRVAGAFLGRAAAVEWRGPV